MVDHNDIGRWGEEQVARYLRVRGWCVEALRWRDTVLGGVRGDVDVVARSEDGVMHFVEVKTRRSTPGDPSSDFAPEQAVTPDKARRMLSLAERYVASCGWEGEISLDVAAVVAGADGEEPVIRYYAGVVR